jgi:hypothetical protein
MVKSFVEAYRSSQEVFFSLQEKTYMDKSTSAKNLPGDELITLMRTVLDRGADFRFTVSGESMSPFIINGDIVTIRPWSWKKPSIGRVVAFIHPDHGKLIIHRIIGKREKFYLIRGDSVFASSMDTVGLENIIGYVSKVERNGKRAFSGLGLEGVLIALLSRNKFFRWQCYRSKMSKKK